MSLCDIRCCEAKLSSKLYILFFLPIFFLVFSLSFKLSFSLAPQQKLCPQVPLKVLQPCQFLHLIKNRRFPPIQAPCPCHTQRGHINTYISQKGRGPGTTILILPSFLLFLLLSPLRLLLYSAPCDNQPRGRARGSVRVVKPAEGLYEYAPPLAAEFLRQCARCVLEVGP